MKKYNFLLILLIFFAKQAYCQESNLDEYSDEYIDTNIVNEIEKPVLQNIEFSNVAILQGLNKNTAKNSILELKIGEKANFGTLNIIAHKCWQAPLDQKPESKILLEVFEEKSKGNQKFENRIFYGWMFASSPSISSLEHPIYDVIAIGCKNSIFEDSK